MLLCSPFSDFLRRGRHRADNLVITRATAEVTGKRVTYFLFAWIRVAIEQDFGRNQKSRGTHATLQGGVLDELGLQRMQAVALRETFNRVDFTAFCLHAQDKAGTNQAAVERHAAGATVACAAAFFGSGQAKLAAQRVELGLVALAVKFRTIAVDRG